MKIWHLKLLHCDIEKTDVKVRHLYARNDTPVKIGRSSRKNSFYLSKQMNVAREHCELFPTPDKLYIKSYSKKSPTYIDNVPIEHDVLTEVKVGQKISLGILYDPQIYNLGSYTYVVLHEEVDSEEAVANKTHIKEEKIDELLEEGENKLDTKISICEASTSVTHFAPIQHKILTQTNDLLYEKLQDLYQHKISIEVSEEKSSLKRKEAPENLEIDVKRIKLETREDIVNHDISKVSTETNVNIKENIDNLELNQQSVTKTLNSVKIELKDENIDHVMQKVKTELTEMNEDVTEEPIIDKNSSHVIETILLSDSDEEESLKTDPKNLHDSESSIQEKQTAENVNPTLTEFNTDINKSLSEENLEVNSYSLIALELNQVTDTCNKSIQNNTVINEVSGSNEVQLEASIIQQKNQEGNCSSKNETLKCNNIAVQIEALIEKTSSEVTTSENEVLERNTKSVEIQSLSQKTSEKVNDLSKCRKSEINKKSDQIKSSQKEIHSSKEKVKKHKEKSDVNSKQRSVIESIDKTLKITVNTATEEERNSNQSCLSSSRSKNYNSHHRERKKNDRKNSSEQNDTRKHSDKSSNRSSYCNKRIESRESKKSHFSREKSTRDLNKSRSSSRSSSDTNIHFDKSKSELRKRSHSKSNRSSRSPDCTKIHHVKSKYELRKKSHSRSRSSSRSSSNTNNHDHDKSKSERSKKSHSKIKKSSKSNRYENRTKSTSISNTSNSSPRQSSTHKKNNQDNIQNTSISTPSHNNIESTQQHSISSTIHKRQEVSSESSKSQPYNSHNTIYTNISYLQSSNETELFALEKTTQSEVHSQSSLHQSLRANFPKQQDNLVEKRVEINPSEVEKCRQENVVINQVGQQDMNKTLITRRTTVPPQNIVTTVTSTVRAETQAPFSQTLTSVPEEVNRLILCMLYWKTDWLNAVSNANFNPPVWKQQYIQLTDSEYLQRIENDIQNVGIFSITDHSENNQMKVKYLDNKMCYANYDLYHKYMLPVCLILLWSKFNSMHRHSKHEVNAFLISTTDEDSNQRSKVLAFKVTTQQDRKSDCPVSGDFVIFELTLKNSEKMYTKKFTGYVRKCTYVGSECHNDATGKAVFYNRHRIDISIQYPKDEIKLYQEVKINKIEEVRDEVLKVTGLFELANSPLRDLILKPDKRNLALPSFAQNQHRLNWCLPNITRFYALLQNVLPLSHEQYEIVMNITKTLRCNKIPSLNIIEGEAGTGKTRLLVWLTLSNLASLMMQDTKIFDRTLICTTSDATLTGLARKIIYIRNKVVIPRKLNDFNMVLLGRPGGHLHPEIAGYSLEELAKISGDPPDTKYSNILRRAHVIVMNIKALTNSHFRETCINRIKIPVVMVDDAQNICELHTLGTLVCSPSKLILAGDLSLPYPAIESKEAAKAGLAYSLLSRVSRALNNDIEQIIKKPNTVYSPLRHLHSENLEGTTYYKLTERQMRMSPHLGQVASSALNFPVSLNDNNINCCLPFKPFVVFDHDFHVNMVGGQTPNHLQQNKHLNQETSLAAQLTRVMEDVIRTRVKQESTIKMLVITGDTYHAHNIINERNRIQKLQTSCTKYQQTTLAVKHTLGLESDITILCVGASKRSVLRNPRSLRLALTRAKHSLIILGNLQFFTKHCQSSEWLTLVNLAARNGAYYKITSDTHVSTLLDHVIRGSEMMSPLIPPSPRTAVSPRSPSPDFGPELPATERKQDETRQQNVFEFVAYRCD